MRAIGYIRVSTDEQGSHGYSLEAQREKVIAYAKLHDLELIDVIEDTASAKNLKRPGIDRVFTSFKKGEADGVIITKLDRITRSLFDWQKLVQKYFDGEKQLWSVHESIDTCSAAGRLQLNILMTVAQWERETISERTKTSLHYMRSQGKRISGRIPFGYDSHPTDPKRLVKNTEEQAVVRRIVELKKSGVGLHRTATLLNQDGVPSKYGGAWKHTTIKSILGRVASGSGI